MIGRQHFLHHPNMVSNSSRHCWCALNGLFRCRRLNFKASVRSAEIEIGDGQRNRQREVFLSDLTCRPLHDGQNKKSCWWVNSNSHTQAPSPSNAGASEAGQLFSGGPAAETSIIAAIPVAVAKSKAARVSFPH